MLFVWGGVAVGQTIGQFFAVYSIRSILSGVVLLAGLGLLATIELADERYPFFPAIFIILLGGVLLGLIWVGVFWGRPAPEYLIN